MMMMKKYLPVIAQDYCRPAKCQQTSPMGPMNLLLNAGTSSVSSHTSVVVELDVVKYKIVGSTSRSVCIHVLSKCPLRPVISVSFCPALRYWPPVQWQWRCDGDQLRLQHPFNKMAE